MREVVHQLDRGEHRLVVLVLVLDDHAVDEAVAQKAVVAIEVGRREDVEHPAAHRPDERARLRRPQDRERRAVPRAGA